MKSSPSLRKLGLLVTATGGAIAAAMALFIVIASRVFDTGMPIVPGMIFIGGLFVLAGGLVTLTVDAVMRLTGHRV